MIGSEIVNFIFYSEILKLPIVSSKDGKRLGYVADLTAVPSQVFPKITGLIAKLQHTNNDVYIPWVKVRSIAVKKNISIEFNPESLRDNHTASESEILLKRTFLDKQIISTSGNKVVRVNDLHLLIDNSSKENSNLWLVHIDIGVKGLFRRLGWDNFMNAVFKWVTSRDIKDKFVSWKYVQPTATTNVNGSLHLKIDSSKLSEIHPADLADILEDLGIDERVSLVESLDHATAAATLQEMPMKIRVQIAESIDSKKLANIVNEMQMDEAVDLLDEISHERRNSVINLLPEEKIPELKELSKLSIYSVGSIMNTDFVTAKGTDTVEEVINLLKAESEKSELIYYIYITDNNERLIGVVTIRHLLSSDPKTVMSDIMSEQIISVEIDTNIKRVAKIFYKYNFAAVPVIDDEKRIRGIISFRDALESVFPEMKEESDL